MKSIIATSKAPAAIGPYSQAVKSGGTLYVSGQIGMDPATGALVEHIRPRDPAALCRRLKVNAYHPNQRILAPGDLAALRDAGFAVNVWTVNDMSEAKRLVAEGATGIITDFPAACRKALGD